MTESKLEPGNAGLLAKTVETTICSRSQSVPPILFSMLSGGLMSLCYPHADFGWLAFVAMTPFLRTFPYVRTRTAFAYGFVCGLTYFTCLLYWIAVFAATKIGGFGVAAWIILSAREALWSGLFAALVNVLWKKSGPLIRCIGAASIWTSCEWLRQLGPLGFGWGDLAYSQWHFLPFIQIASITGIWGITWLIVYINAAVASMDRRTLALACVLSSIVLINGGLKIQQENAVGVKTVAASLQANISEDVPYAGLRPASSDYFYGTLSQFDRMAQAAKDRCGATICVTAETSIPGYPNLDLPLKSILRGISQKDGVALIVGARDVDFKSGLDTNSVFTFLPDGTEYGPYNKSQLVPFGEYVPYRKDLPFLNSFHVLNFEMQPGSADQAPLPVGGGNKAGIAVCYESTYPRFLREQVLRGATFDVVVTDDTWYGRTAAAEQHLAMSILRAVETDRYLVRCASTGVSAVISPTGKVLSRANIFTCAVVSAPIEQRRDLTFYVCHGDWFAVLCTAASVIVLIFLKENLNRIE